MKGLLIHAPPLFVHLAFAQQHTLAEKALRLLLTAALEEVAVVVDEYVADVVRVIDEEDALEADAERAHVAVCARQTSHEAQRVASAFRDERPEEAVAVGAGYGRVGHGAFRPENKTGYEVSARRVASRAAIGHTAAHASAPRPPSHFARRRASSSALKKWRAYFEPSIRST